MNRNVEIKARIGEVEGVRERVEALADDGPVQMDQEDTFFQSCRGRLKLRKIPDMPGELIFYQRPDSRGPKESQYGICRLSDPGDLEMILAGACGIRGIVRKHRTLYRIGRTRVHLDQVEGLGSFLELEVVLEPSESVPEGVNVAYDLMERLGVPPASLVDAAYIDMLEAGPT